MGFFNRKKVNLDKSYTTAEALRILNDSKFENYTTEEVIDNITGDTKYKIVPIVKAVPSFTSIETKERVENSGRAGWTESIRVNKTIESQPRFNNYQSAKSYQKTYGSIDFQR